MPFRVRRQSPKRNSSDEWKKLKGTIWRSLTEFPFPLEKRGDDLKSEEKDLIKSRVAQRLELL